MGLLPRTQAMNARYKNPDNFYKDCEKIYNENVVKVLNKFINEINSFKNIIESSNVTFEGIAYHLINKNNFIKELQEIFPTNIKVILEQDFNYYIR